MEGGATGTPFRGGFRYLRSDDGAAVTADVWGADLAEVLARTVEAACRAAGVPDAPAPAPPQRVECRGDDIESLLDAAVAHVLGRLASDGVYLTAARCTSLARIDAGGELPPGFAALLVCDAQHVVPPGESELVAVQPAGRRCRAWREGQVLRVQVHLRAAPAADAS